MDETWNTPRTLIVIDPSSPHGEGGLDMLTADDRAVTLMVTLGGESAASLREFAAAEEIDVSRAGLIDLDQVACRLSSRTGDIDTISTNGSNAVGEIFHMLQQQPVMRVILPASLPGIAATDLSRLVRMCPVPVIVAPAAGRATELSMAS